ncbi:MAG: transmembrane emp24 domain-containing protein 10 [Amphiamblys sp. WSBS2006]|nr:MAG: transmembrane emp24 domain-containing protein 10 [Amphiamblys sp. WSBS2006]
MLQFFLLLSAVLSINFELDCQAKEDHRWGRSIEMELGPRKLVTGNFKLSGAPDQIASAKIVDNLGNTHYYHPDIPSEGVRYSFRTHEKTLQYKLFVRSVSQSAEEKVKQETRDVEITCTSGHDLFDKENAEKFKIQPVVSRMVRLSGVMNDISDGLEELLESGTELQKQTGSVFKRVFIINLFAIFVTVAVGVWQFFHLRKFFKTKKLI